MKILIVDDEALARERLRSMIAELQPNAAIEQAENGRRALELIQQQAPDVIMLDIRMPVMSGLETARHIAGLKAPPAIVFTTAYQEHALSAFESHAIDYLLKPVRRERLKTALERAELIQRSRLDNLRVSLDEAGSRTHLSALSHGSIQLIPVNDIRYLKADQKYVSVGCPLGELLVDESLKSLENEFPGVFIRAHRNALVAIKHISALRKCAGSGHEICLDNAETAIPVSRRHLPGIRRLMKTISR